MPKKGLQKKKKKNGQSLVGKKMKKNRIPWTPLVRDEDGDARAATTAPMTSWTHESDHLKASASASASFPAAAASTTSASSLSTAAPPPPVKWKATSSESKWTPAAAAAAAAATVGVVQPPASKSASASPKRPVA